MDFMKSAKPSYVYLAARSDGFLKVGISISPSQRISAFLRPQTGIKSPLVQADTRATMVLLRTAAGGRREERQVHDTLKQFLVLGCNEWFHDTPASRRLAERALALLGPDMRDSEKRLVGCSVRMPRPLLKEIRLHCLEEGGTLNSFVQEALEDYFGSSPVCAERI